MEGALPIRQLFAVVKGSSATLRARLIAVVKRRWWRAQFPVILLGVILPRSVTNCVNILTSL
jgi:hypothetical protein